MASQPVLKLPVPEMKTPALETKVLLATAVEVEVEVEMLLVMAVVVLALSR